MLAVARWGRTPVTSVCSRLSAGPPGLTLLPSAPPWTPYPDKEGSDGGPRLSALGQHQVAGTLGLARSNHRSPAPALQGRVQFEGGGQGLCQSTDAETPALPAVNGDGNTFAAFLELWLAGIEGELRTSTFDWYAGYVRRNIVPALGDRRLCELTRTEVRAFYSTLPPRIVERVRRTLRRALYEAVASDLNARNQSHAVAVSRTAPPPRGPIDSRACTRRAARRLEGRHPGRGRGRRQRTR